jgi:carboxypeptidase Q
MNLPLLSALLVSPTTAGVQAGEQVPAMDAVAQALHQQAMASDEAWQELRHLCDHIGHRLAGSEALARAVEWGAEELRSDGLEVQLEPVQVPVWIRGEERVELISPLQRPLDVLTLGGSVGTGAEGIEAEVMVVGSFEELEQRGAEAQGKVVLFDDPWEDYGQAVQYRGHGAVAAARQGAVAALVRSPTPVSLGTPHTGGMHYEDGVPEVPAVAVTTEDAAWMRRLIEAGEPVRVRLSLGARLEEAALSHNVVGQLAGRERPDQVVILGCHLDSWDVGQGAQDDGAGCVTVMAAGALLAAQDQAPRRSVRVVLYANEEFGISGGKAYALAHAHELQAIVAAVEVDTGAGAPQGYRVDIREPGRGERSEAGGAAAIAMLEPYTALLDDGAATLEASWSGADIWPLVAQGVPGLGLMQDTSGYWPIHHTRADTLDKIDPVALQANVASVAVMAWILAEMPEPLPRLGQADAEAPQP